MSFPDDVDLAAIAYLEEYPDDNNTLAIIQCEISQADRPPLEYWDTECDKDRNPLNRAILLIDIENGKTQVWSTPTEGNNKKKVPADSGERTRSCNDSLLWSELSKTHLGATGGRHTTEKAEKAIKMHCPLPFLQPLITL